MSRKREFYQGLYVDGERDVWRLRTDGHPDGEAEYSPVLFGGRPAADPTATWTQERLVQAFDGLWLIGSPGAPRPRISPRLELDDSTSVLLLGYCATALVCAVVLVASIALGHALGWL